MSASKTRMENTEAQDILDLLQNGPKAYWQIRQYLHICCCSESRPRATSDMLDELAEAGLVECRGGLFYVTLPEGTLLDPWGETEQPD